MTKEITLSNGEICLVDDSDFPMLSVRRWFPKKAFHLTYASRCEVVAPGKRVSMSMHSLLMKPPRGFVVDHVNGNGLDNRRENLRIVTLSHNSMNRKLRIDSRTGVRGVTKTRSGKFTPHLQVDGNQVLKGAYDTVEEALAVRMAAEEKYFGEYASKHR